MDAYFHFPCYAANVAPPLAFFPHRCHFHHVALASAAYCTSRSTYWRSSQSRPTQACQSPASSAACYCPHGAAALLPFTL
eukprot:5385279-Amphidinium_carterae.1